MIPEYVLKLIIILALIYDTATVAILNSGSSSL
jgi:hypothetical protein